MNTTDEKAQKRQKRFTKRREALLRVMREDVAKLREMVCKNPPAK